MTKKETILKDYINLCRKLGKMATINDAKKFMTESTIKHHFGNLGKLKEAAIERKPSLKSITMPAVLAAGDIEAFRLGIEAKGRKGVNKKLVSNVSTLDYIAKFAEKVFSGRVEPVNIPQQTKPLNRAINLTLSDLHFGADIKSEETGFLTYGTVQESRRFAKIIQQTIEYKPEHRDSTELHINLAGDVIDGKLHDNQNAAFFSEQVCRAIHLLIQGFALLAENFIKVIIHCATGNHGRDKNRHKERASSGKWDSFETIIYYAVKQALSKYSNLTVDIPKTPFNIYSVFGHKVFATHGDTVLSPGNPGKSINIGAMENQVNRINASMKDNDEIKVAVVGHTHCASLSLLASGAFLVTNGCLPPVDQFAVSIGILENKASQTIFEMTGQFPIGDIRFVQVNDKTDKDKSLDKIITPWTSF